MVHKSTSKRDRTERQADAKEAQADRNKMTAQQQLAALDNRLGHHLGAKRERARLWFQLKD